MFLLVSYNVTSKQEYREQLQHWVWWTTGVLNVIQQKMCQDKVIQEYQSLLCWERWVRRVLSAIHPSLNTCRGAEEVHMSLLTVLAAMIKHELALLFFSAIGSYFPGNPESLAAMLEFGGIPVFPITCQGKHCICRVLSWSLVKTRLPHLGAGGLFVGRILVVWGLLQQVRSWDHF